MLDSDCWGPLVCKDVGTNVTSDINIRVVNPSDEVDLRWLEWVGFGKMNI